MQKKVELGPYANYLKSLQRVTDPVEPVSPLDQMRTFGHSAKAFLGEYVMGVSATPDFKPSDEQYLADFEIEVPYNQVQQ